MGSKGLRGEGGAKFLDPRFSHFVAPPLPISNGQSLIRTLFILRRDMCKRKRMYIIELKDTGQYLYFVYARFHDVVRIV